MACGASGFSSPLIAHMHSLRYRLKSAEHLRGKLVRKCDEARTKGVPFDITSRNLFVKIRDLVGIRILYLHTREFEMIDKALREIFRERKYWG
jgi:ppGpp synthetase/RelA/SpoT-type nucleotidyltranferase